MVLYHKKKGNIIIALKKTKQNKTKTNNNNKNPSTLPTDFKLFKVHMD